MWSAISRLRCALTPKERAVTDCAVVHQEQTATVVVEVLRTQVVAVQEPVATVVQLPDGAPAVVQQGATAIAQGMQPGALVVQPVLQTAVVAVGVQGAPGPQGIPGPAGGEALQRVAGATLSALVPVWEDEHGRVWPLVSADLDHVFCLLGVTLTAADVGLPVDVQRAGVMNDAGWAWVPGQRVYLGDAGQLTQTPVEVGAHVLIGVAVSATRLNLMMQDPVLLAPEQGD